MPKRRRIQPDEDLSKGLDALLAEVPFHAWVFYQNPRPVVVEPQDLPPLRPGDTVQTALRTWAANNDATYQPRRALVETLHRKWHAERLSWDLDRLLKIVRWAKREKIWHRPHGLGYRRVARRVQDQAELAERVRKPMASLGWPAPEVYEPGKFPLPEGRPGQPWVAGAMRRLYHEARVRSTDDRTAWLQAYGILPLS